MKDLQSAKDARRIAIAEVGIKDIVLPLYIEDKVKGRQLVVAKTKMSVNLLASARGTHMSRFVEAIEHYKGRNFNHHKMEQMIRDIRKKLKARSARAEISFDYFIEKPSPVSKKKALMNYEAKIAGEINSAGRIKISLGARVPVSSVCPCSKAISAEGAHNQRAVVEIFAELKKFVWLEELIALAEKAGGSSEVFSLLKREDEKFVTEKMFANPKFVEDIVRDIAVALKKDKRIGKFSVECVSFESIHNHNAYARVGGGR